MNNLDERAGRLIYTSADDCRASLHHCGPADVVVLRRALEMLDGQRGVKTKQQLIRRKLRQLEESK